MSTELKKLTSGSEKTLTLKKFSGLEVLKHKAKKDTEVKTITEKKTGKKGKLVKERQAGEQRETQERTTKKKKRQ